MLFGISSVKCNSTGFDPFTLALTPSLDSCLFVHQTAGVQYCNLCTFDVCKDRDCCSDTSKPLPNIFWFVLTKSGVDLLTAVDGLF
jgi:hypothetical protein